MKGMRMVVVQEEVRRLRKKGKGKDMVAKDIGRVNTSVFERLE
jgi:hypothetical protein